MRIFETTRNGLFMGFIFVSMGLVFAHRIVKMKMHIAVLGFAGSMVALFVESFALEHFSIPRDYNMYVSLIPATFFLFYIALNLKLKDRKVYGKMRVLGVLIFGVHLFPARIVEIALPVVHGYLGIDLSAMTFAVVMASTVTIALLMEFLSHKRRFCWLRWLYS